MGRPQRHRRPRRARLEPERAGLGRGERLERGVPGRQPLPARRALLRRAAPAAGRRGRRGRRQHPPLRASTSATGGAHPARARRGRDRRGPPAGGHHVEHDRAGHRRRPLRQPGPPGPADPRRPRAPRRRAPTPAPTSASSWRQVGPAPAVAAPRPLAESPGRGRLAIERLLARAAVDRRPTWPRPTSAALRAQKAAASLAERRRRRARCARGRGRVGRRHGRTSPGSRSRRSTWPRCSAEGVWSRRTAVLTTATVPLNLPERVGLPPDRDRSARRRQPLRLRGPRAALLRRPPARPAPAGLPGRRCTTSWRP